GDEMTAKPVVLLGYVGKRALTGQLERRHAVGLIELHVRGRRHGARVYQPTKPRGRLRCRPVPPALSAEEIRDVNTRYHDVAADHYDAKWGIDFGDIGLEQVGAKVRKALDGKPRHYARSLEIGSGTGYFTLNLLRAGLIERAT